MAFYCKCEHTRGKHIHPTKSSSNVGKCTAIVGTNQGVDVVCACRHYVARDTKFSQMRDYQKTNTAYMIIAFVTSIGLTAWIGNLEESIGYEPLHIGAMIAGLLVLLCWWFKFGESFLAPFKKECLE